MKNLLITGSLVFATALFSCDSGKTKSTDTKVEESGTGTPGESAVNPSLDNIQSGEIKTGNENNTTIQSADVNAQQQVTAAVGMNPAHGQPGHRCDIAVGAPLNSPPGKPADNLAAPASPGTITTQTPTDVTPVTAAPSPSPANVPTLPGMNPPHGQPGHDCAIPVGSPLKK